MVSTSAPTYSPELQPTDIVVRSSAAGRVRMTVPWLRVTDRAMADRRAVAIEESVARVTGVRAVHAYPRTASVVVWFRADTERDAIDHAIAAATHADPANLPDRAPHSADVTNADLLRMGIGAGALVLLGFRRYGFRRPPLLGPASRTVATGVTIFSGYPFLRGALRSLRGGRAGTDALVSAATIASLLLRENVVALTVLWLLNIGEFLQDLTLRRTRRAIADLLRGTQDTAWVRLADGTEVQVAIDALHVGDAVIVHEQVAVAVDGVVVDGEAVVDQSALTGENLPVTKYVGDRVQAGSVVLTGRIVIEAHAVGDDTSIGRIIGRVEEAQRDRAPIQTVGENFSRRFVPASFALSALTLLVTRDLRRAMTMLLIACPWCGPRDEVEFAYGGEAHRVRPEQPADVPADRWADYLFMRTNAKGLHLERWVHAHGCRRWFNVARDTTTERIHAVYRAGERPPPWPPSPTA